MVFKQRMWMEQNKKCYWCGRQIEFHTHVDGVPIPANAVTVDHIYPVNHPVRQGYKKRGESSPFVIACFACNNNRGNMPFDEYKLLAAVRFHNSTAAADDKQTQARVVKHNQSSARPKGFGKHKRGKS